MKSMAFDGDFKRRPLQDLSGASSKFTRQDVIQKAQQERQKREEKRVRDRSIVTMQKTVRSFTFRSKFKRLVRERLMGLRKMSHPDSELEALDELFNCFVYIYDPKIDFDNLTWIVHLIIKNKNRLGQLLLNNSNGYVWRFRVKKVLEFCVNALNTKSNHGLLLRILEIFFSNEFYAENVNLKQIQREIALYVVKKDYFCRLRQFLSDCVNIESNPTLSADVGVFILKPLLLIEDDSTVSWPSANEPLIEFDAHKDAYNCQVFKCFCNEVLAAPLSTTLLENFHSQLHVLKGPIKKQFYGFLRENLNDIDLNVYFLHSILKLEPNETDDFVTLRNFLYAVSAVSFSVSEYSQFNKILTADDALFLNVDDDRMSIDDGDDVKRECLDECVRMINDERFIYNLLSNLNEVELNKDVVYMLSRICFDLITTEDQSSKKYRLLYTLAFKPDFLKAMWNKDGWNHIVAAFRRGARVRVLDGDEDGLLPEVRQLITFCELFNVLLNTLHDHEFWQNDITGESTSSSKSMPFKLTEVITMCDVLKNLIECLIDVIISSSGNRKKNRIEVDCKKPYGSIKYWMLLYHCVVKLIKTLHNKNSRKKFCDEDFWYSTNIFNFPIEDQPQRIEQIVRLFHLDDESPPLTMCEMRWLKVLKDIPFLIPFMSRILLFRSLVKNRRSSFQNEMTVFLTEHNRRYTIRRSHIYEDAFEQIKKEEIMDRFRIALINEAGAREAGVDGGGVFREFMYELLKACFDPRRGFFLLNNENLLYPNPHIERIVDSPYRHYYFIGMMLGKSLYENIHVEIPIAEFVLLKLISQNTNVDLHYMASLDQVLYKNMLFLKNYEGDVQDLGLDFSIINEEFGDNVMYELMPNGQNIPVTNRNKIEYMHLLADFKLNKQIAKQCSAFKNGLCDVIDMAYLRLFSIRELQLLISGPDYEIDIDDLQKHTQYAYSTRHTEPTVIMFWEVVRTFDRDQKRQLLKFVTSCSRPPLLGFRDFDPPFTINVVDSSPICMFPTASTCTNYLKLPRVESSDVLKERLLFSIYQGQGFELS